MPKRSLRGIYMLLLALGLSLSVRASDTSEEVWAQFRRLYYIKKRSDTFVPRLVRLWATVLATIATQLSAVFVLLLGGAWVPPASAQARLQYQDRGNRYEGVKPKPVSGYNIELISALVDNDENLKVMPDRLKIKFNLAGSPQVYLTVRELDYKYYYWMDRVQPASPWKAGFDNVFEWRTTEVLQQLQGMKSGDLAVLVRLNRPEPSAIERVAPAILYSSQLPERAVKYLFAFRVSSDARLGCAVYKGNDAAPIYTVTLPRQRGGRPFVVQWNSSSAPKGWYRLVITGYFLDANNQIEQTVSFYHEPLIQ